MNIIYQAQKKGCGFACVKMALCEASGRKDFAYAPERIINGSAPSFGELVEYARQYGLSLGAYKVDDPRRLLDATEFPILISVVEDGLHHMVVLESASKRNFVILDPARGKRVIKKEDLVSIFEGKYLAIEHYEDICPRFHRLRPMKASSSALMVVFSLLPILSLSLGLLFLGAGGENFPIALVCFSFALLGVASSRAFASMQLKKFDGRYLKKVDDPRSYAREERFVHYHLYKAAALSSLSRLVTSAFEVAAALVLFGIRDGALALSLCSGLLLVVLDYLLESDKEKRMKREVEQLEQGFLRGAMSEARRREVLDSLALASNKYGRSLIIRDALVLSGALALAAITIVAFGGEITVERYLLYALATGALMQQGGSALREFDSYEEKKREEPFFVLHFCLESPRGE